MARKHKHLTKKGLITLSVLGLCALVMYFTWGRGSLYMLQSQSKALKPQSKLAQSVQGRGDDEPQTRARLCMLNFGSCPLTFVQQESSPESNKQISASIQAIPNDITSLESVVFRVQGEDFSQLRAVIFGLNMDMGEVVVQFHKVDDKLYEGRAILASCTEEVMQYRMELETNHGSAAVDFDAKRKRVKLVY